MNDAVTPGDLSHALLVAVLMAHGGAIDIPTEYLTDPACIGGLDGGFHQVTLEPQPDGGLRFTVIASDAHVLP